MNHSERDIQQFGDSAPDFEEVPDTSSDGSAICIAKPAPLTEYVRRIYTRSITARDSRTFERSCQSLPVTKRLYERLILPLYS